MSEVGDTIKAAKKIIGRGWHQGDWRKEDGSGHCVLGALELLDRKAMYGSAAEDAIEATIRCAYPEAAAVVRRQQRRLVSYFNDYVAKSKEDVFMVLDKTLAELGSYDCRD